MTTEGKCPCLQQFTEKNETCLIITYVLNATLEAEDWEFYKEGNKQ